MFPQETHRKKLKIVKKNKNKNKNIIRKLSVIITEKHFLILDKPTGIGLCLPFSNLFRMIRPKTEVSNYKCYIITFLIT